MNESHYRYTSAEQVLEPLPDGEIKLLGLVRDGRLDQVEPSILTDEILGSRNRSGVTVSHRLVRAIGQALHAKMSAADEAFAGSAAGATDYEACQKFGTTFDDLAAAARRAGREEDARWIERSQRIVNGTATRADGEDEIDDHCED